MVFWFLPNSAVHQWQVSIDGGNNWQDLSDGANYSGVNKDTLNYFCPAVLISTSTGLTYSIPMVVGQVFALNLLYLQFHLIQITMV